MRETRYLWINNLPANPSEDVKNDIKTVLESHGKIQSVRYVESGDSGNGIVVAFMDVKSATKALEFSNKLTNGVRLNLEYCESTGLNNSSLIPSIDIKTPGNINSSTENKIDDKRRRSPDKSFSNRSRSSSVSSSDSGHSFSSSHKHRNRLTDRKNAQPARWRCDKYRSSEEHNIGQRGLRVTQLPLRSTDTSIREGLFHEYKKHGKITSVVVDGQGPGRTAIITFKKSDDMEKGFDDSKDKIFFASAINVERHSGFDVEDPDLCPPEIALDEFHPKATKTLFVGNLPTDVVSDKELLKAFEKFGTIIDLDIKQQTNQPGTSYAFIQYADIRSVVRALNSTNITRVCGKAVKLGFGKSQPTNCIWLANLSDRIKDHHLSKHFSHFGSVTKILLDEEYLSALVFFASVESAQKSLIETKNRPLVGQKVHIDFASIEFQRYFLNRSDVSWMVSHGNNENYREYSNCNNYHYGPFPYERNPYSDERNRRHFEEIRLSDDPYRRLERQPSYRDYDNAAIKPRGRYNDEIRSNTSGSGKKHNSKERTDAYLFTNRIRSESPYSVKGNSRSKERDPVRDNNSKSPRRSSKDRSSRSRSSRNQSIQQQHEDREESIGRSTRERNGRRKSGSNSRSHSHRSNSVSNKVVRDPVTQRGVDCGSSATSGHPDSSNSEDSPYFSSGYSDSHSEHHSTGITRPPVSLSSSLVGDVSSSTAEPTTDRLNYLEQERIQLIMELKRLDSGSDLPPNTSPSLLATVTPTIDSESDDKFAPSLDSIRIESARSNRVDPLKDSPKALNGLIDHSMEKFELSKGVVDQSTHSLTNLNCGVTKSTIVSTAGCDNVTSFTSPIRNVCDNDSDRLLSRLSSSSPNKLSASTDSPSPSALRMHSSDNIIASAPSSTASTSPSAKPVSSQIPNLYLPPESRNQLHCSNSFLSNIPLDTSSPNTSRTASSEMDNSSCQPTAPDVVKPSLDSPSLRDPRLNAQSYLFKSHSVCDNSPLIKSPDIHKSSPFTPNLSASSEKLTSPEQSSGNILSVLCDKQKYSDGISPPSTRAEDYEASDNEEDSMSNDVILEERIRLLDNKLKQDIPRTRPSVDYSKYMRRKKVDSSSNHSQVSTPLSAPSCGTFSLLSSTNDCDTSEFMKSMLSSKPSMESYSSAQSLETHRSSLEACSAPNVSDSVIQPLTISTGDISTPSSLSSPGSASLPVRSQFNLISAPGPVAVVSAVSANSHSSMMGQRMNCKLEPDFPVKSILKKDNPSPVNNNNNTYQYYPLDSNVTSVCHRVQRPLSSLNPNTPRSSMLNGSHSTHRYNGSLNSPVLSTPPLRSSDSGSVPSPLFPNISLTATPSHSPSLNATPTSKCNVQRPSGQPLPSPKHSDTPNQISKFPSLTNALSTNSSNAIKRKVGPPDEGRKAKVSKIESRSPLDDSLFSPVLVTKKKKLKPESTIEDSKVMKKSSEMLDCSKAEDVHKNTFEIKSETHKERKHSHTDKTDKEKRKKEKSQHSFFSSSYSKEATIEKLFGNCDDLDKREKKRHSKELKQEKSEDRQSKKEKKLEKEKSKEKLRLSSLSESVDSNKSRKNALTEEKKKTDHNSDSDEGWKIALAVQDPYESMYDKIKRRTSKEAERKQQPIVNDFLKQEKKSRNKHRKSQLYGSDPNLSDCVQSSTTNETSSRSLTKKSKSSKLVKNKQSKRLDLSDDDLSDAPILSKKSRLDEEQSDDSGKYSISKSKKKMKKLDDSSCKRKQDYLKKAKRSRLKEEKFKKKNCSDVSPTFPKGLISVDSVFSDSDTSRASSPVCVLSSIHDHSSNESKTTPSTEPMDNSETESHSNVRKTSEDEWKMIASASPRADLLHSKIERFEKECESLSIIEDLPCLEKQPEEEILPNSPRSIDDEPPEHLESIYDSPPPPPVSMKESELTEESYDDIKDEEQEEEEEAEQSLAVASILKTEPETKHSPSISCSLSSPFVSAAVSVDSSLPIKSPVKESKVTPIEDTEPVKRETEPPTLPPEVPILDVKPIDLKSPKDVSEFNASAPQSELVTSQKSSSVELNVPPHVTLPHVAKINSWEMITKQQLVPPKPTPPTAVSVSANVTSFPATSTVTSLSTARSYLPADAAPTVHTPKSSRNVDSAHDAPDYTSYVQSVIERVKQEKDEESHHSRDKSVKRQKKNTSSTNVNSTQNWSTSQTIIPERRQSAGATIPTKKVPDPTWNNASSLPPIPGVNACTPVSVAKSENLPMPINTNNKSTFLSTASVLGCGATSSVLSNVAPQPVTPLMSVPMQFSVNPAALLTPQAAQIAPILTSHLPTLSRDTFDAALLQANSPQCSTNSQAEDLKIRKRMNRRSGSFSKSEKPDTLDETISYVLRKGLENREDLKQVGALLSNCNDIRAETDAISDDKEHHPIDPYEPDFDDSPLQINLNRDLHRNRLSTAASTSSEPTFTTCTVTSPSVSVSVVHSSQSPQFINTMAPAVATTSNSQSLPALSNSVTECVASPVIAATTVTKSTVPDSVDQIINEVAQGHFDIEKYFTYFKNNPLSVEEDRNSFNLQDSSNSSSLVDYSDHSKLTKQFPQQRDQQSSVLNNSVPFTMASLLNFNRPDLLNNPMVLAPQIQMIPYPQLTQMSTGLSNQVQIPGVNAQSFAGLDERTFNLDRLQNPLVTSLNININSRQTVPPVSTSVSLPSCTSAQSIVSQSFDSTYSKVTAPTNSSNQAMPSPVLISRPSSNPTGRPTPGGYISTTPDHTSPLASTTPRSQTHNGPISNPTGQSPNTAAFNPGAFEGANHAGAIEYLNLLYLNHQQQFSKDAAILALQQQAVAAAVAGKATSPAILLNYQSNFRATTPDARPSSQSSHTVASTAGQQFLPNSTTANTIQDSSSYENPVDKLQSLDPRFRKVWKGRLALKNEEVHVEMNFVHGNNDLIKECMNMAGHSLDQPLKIVQRMRLEASQLEGVQRKMQQDSDFCMCLALASSNGLIDLPRMSNILRETFIKYLQEKVAAGIINVSHQEYQQAYVVHIFPPCEFSDNQLQLLAPNLSKWITEHSVPHLLVVITTV